MAKVIILCTCPYIDLHTPKNLTSHPLPPPTSRSIKTVLQFVFIYSVCTIVLKGQRDESHAKSRLIIENFITGYKMR